jgi:hypothetical protein
MVTYVINVIVYSYFMGEELETSVSEMDDLETPVSSHENIHLDESMDKNQSTVSMTTRSTTEQQIVFSFTI